MDFDSDLLGRDIGVDTEADEDHALAHQAAASGDTQLLISAIKQDPSVIQQTDSDGYTPLAHAVLGKHLQALKKLVKMGADVNVQDAQGRTCLSIAAYQGWSEGVIYLLRKGARQDIVDRSGRTPLHAATYDTDTRSLLALMKRLSLEEINIGDHERMTALHWAAFHNRPEHVRQLLQKGAKPLQADIDGKTPLHWAAQNGSASCCQLLVEQFADTATSIDNCGKTAVHLAAAAGHAAILQELARAAPTTCESWDKDDRTPLHWAAATGHTSCVRALLNIGVTPNPVDVDGVTPLEYATNAGHKECVVLLRDRLGIKSHVNKNKQTEPKQSASSFFKGLFSRKREPDKNKDTSQSKTRLPAVSSNKTDQLTGRNSVGINGGDNNLNTHGSVKKEMCVDVKNGNISQREQQIVTPREGGSKKKKRQQREVRDAGVSTPTTVKSMSSWNDNSSHRSGPSEVRSTHLSPLSGLRPPSVSPRISHSPGLSSLDSVPKRRQGGLSPLRMDKMVKERAEIPSHEHVPKSIDEGPSTPTSYFTFNVNGKSVLPDIHSGMFVKEHEQFDDQFHLEHGRSGKTKKRKKKRHEKDQIDEIIPAVSPHEHVTNIYRPQDRGRVTNLTDLESDRGNFETKRSKIREKRAENEVIQALTGLQIDELNGSSSQ